MKGYAFNCVYARIAFPSGNNSFPPVSWPPCNYPDIPGLPCHNASAGVFTEEIFPKALENPVILQRNFIFFRALNRLTLRFAVLFCGL
jgi:hypothetical protein